MKNHMYDYIEIKDNDINAVFPVEDGNEFLLLKNSYPGRSLEGFLQDILNNDKSVQLSNDLIDWVSEKKIKICRPKYIVFLENLFVKVPTRLNTYSSLNVKFAEYILLCAKGRCIYECAKWEYELLTSIKDVMPIDDALNYLEQRITFFKLTDISAKELIRKWELNKVIRYSMTDNLEYHKVTDKYSPDNRLINHMISETPEFKVFRIVITQECHLSCLYCYYDDTISQSICPKNTLSKEQLKSTIDFIYAIAIKKQQKNISIQWWGGDPACCEDMVIWGTEYAKNLFLNSYTKVEFAICSSFVSNNTQRFLDYLIDNNYQITISCDGPKEINNHNKILKYPKNCEDNCFDKTMTVFSYLSNKIPCVRDELANQNYSNKKLSKPKIKFRCTLRIEDIDCYSEICSFFEQLGYSYRICLVSDINTINSKNLFRRKMLDHYRQMEELIVKAFLEHSPIEELSPLFCNAHTNPIENLRFLLSRCGFGGGNYIINIDGNIYTCHRFNGIKEFCVGNIDSNYEEIVKNTSALRQRWNLKYDKCIDCKKQPYCSGGCAYEAYIVYETIWKTALCPSYDIFFEKAITNYLFAKLFPQYSDVTLNVEQCHTVRNIWC